LQQTRCQAEYRCPYCLFIAIQRSEASKHLKDVHGAYIVAYEPHGMTGANARMESLRKAGVRKMETWRATQHLKELKDHVSPYAYSLVHTAVSRILLEALVLIGSAEDKMQPRYFKEIKSGYQTELQ